MLLLRHIRDQQGLAAVRAALSELVIRDLLSGLSLQGTIGIREAETETLCTDGRNVYYSPTFVKSLSCSDLAFDLLHEWLHIFGNHCARRGDRDPKLWNIAADCVVVKQACDIFSNGFERWPPPSDGIIPPVWTYGLSVEEIYNQLLRNQEHDKKGTTPPPMPGFGQSTDSPKGEARPDLLEPPQSSPEEEAAFLSTFVQELTQAKAIQDNRGAKVHSFVSERIAEISRNDMPWERLLLGDVLDRFGFARPTYNPPNRRRLPFAIVPSMRSTKTKSLLLAIDVSTSVPKMLLKRFASTVSGAVARADTTTVVTFDSTVRSERIIRSSQEVRRALRLITGSHSCTCTEPVFEVARRLRPSTTVVLTDLFVSFPRTPHPNTLWVTPEEAPQAPWGRQFRMKMAW